MALIYTSTARSILLRRASRLQREAAWHAVKAAACRSNQLAEASIRHTARFVDLSTQADQVRDEARRHSRPARRTSGWYHSSYCGETLTVVNVDVHHHHSSISVDMVVYFDCDTPSEYDESDLQRAARELLDALNLDPSTVEWTHAEDLELSSVVATMLPDGYVLSVKTRGEEPEVPWDDRSEDWLVLNYAR